MRKTLIAAVLASAFASGVATAELSYNVGLASEYSYRGISQSDNDPALSGGIDFSHESGLYLGTWASTISWLEDTATYSDSNVEVDVYGGFKFEVTPSIGLDVGVLRYIYPGDVVPGNLKADTTEVYVAGSYEMVTLKYSYSTTNLFGVANSKNSGYLEANAGFEIVDGYNLDLHVGQQTVENDSTLDYIDYKVGVSKDFGFMSGSLAVVGTDIKPKGDLTEDRVIVSVSKSF